jgi:hypothetical protein
MRTFATAQAVSERWHSPSQDDARRIEHRAAEPQRSEKPEFHRFARIAFGSNDRAQV